MAGGAIRDYLSGDKIKDIDVFTSSKEVEGKLIAFFKEKGELINENDLLANYTFRNKWFQVIKNKHYTTGWDLINSFDFIICQAALGVELLLYPEENRKEFKTHFFLWGIFSRHLN